MLYELLVSGKYSRIIHYQPKATAIWGTKEIEPAFYKIDYEGTEEEILYMKQNCMYQFTEERFYNMKHFIPYTPSNLTTDEAVLEASSEQPFDENYNFQEIFDYLIANPDAELIPEERKHHATQLIEYYAQDEVKRILWALNLGDYNTFRRSIQSLSIPAQNFISNRLTKYIR